MSTPRLCPECQAEIPADSPAGLCPKCLLKAGLASQPSEVQATQPHTPPHDSSGFVPPTPPQLAARFPQLEILELLGRGGMGVVYKARQRGLDRLVAVKILPPEISRDPAFAERFSREAKALARLSHQHIVTIHDFGQADGQFYFVMEFVDGVNLREAMHAGKIDPKQALNIVTQVCDALQFAHDEGIVHRDIKPANILIDKRGRVKIADFGLAKLLGQNQPDIALTGTHQVMGTLRYMAPEQMEGSKTVDHRADIYSLGVVFYELLTGELPMGRFAPPSKKVQVDVRLDEVVLRALEKEPELRYQRASEVKTDVEAVSSVGGRPTQSSAAPSRQTSIISVPFHVTWVRALNMWQEGVISFDGVALKFESKNHFLWSNRGVQYANVPLFEIKSFSLNKSQLTGAMTLHLQPHRLGVLSGIPGYQSSEFKYEIAPSDEAAAQELQRAVSGVMPVVQRLGEVKTDAEMVSELLQPRKAPSGEIKVATSAAMDADELERLVLPMLPDGRLDAVKLYREKAGVDLSQAINAIDEIQRRHGMQVPAPSPWKVALVVVIFVGLLALMGALALFARNWWKFVSPIVYVPVLLIVIGFFAVDALRFRGKPRGSVAFTVLHLLLLFTITFPLLDLLAEPEPWLTRLYDLTGISPGPYDVGFLQAVGVAIWLWILSPAIGLFFKRIKLKAKEREKLEPAEQVKAPAGWLVATGVTQVITSLIWLPMSFQEQIPWLAALSIGSALLGLFVVLGGVKMMRYEGYQRSKLTCYAAMIPSVGFGWLQGIPIGIWTLRTLRRPHVRIAFAEKERQIADEMLALEKRLEGGGIPFRYYLKTMLLAGLGWLLFPLLWNFRELGIGVACFVMAALTLWLAWMATRYLPASVARWQNRPAWGKTALLTTCLLLGASAYFMFFTGCYDIWNHMNWNESVQTSDEFRREYQGAEHKLLRRLEEFKLDVPRAELTPNNLNRTFGGSLSFSGSSALGDRLGEIIIAWFFGVLLLWGVYHIVLSDVAWWAIGWKRFGSCAIGLTFLTLLPVWPLGIGLSIASVVNQPSQSLHLDISTSGNFQTISARLRDWSLENGYGVEDSASWELTSIPDNKHLAEVALIHYWRHNIFDQWEMTSASLQRASPDIALEIICSATSTEAVVRLHAQVRAGDDATALAIREDIEGLKQAIGGSVEALKQKPLRETLLGAWVAEKDEMRKLLFRSDGTVEETTWELFAFEEKKKEVTVNSQYTWLEDERIEFKSPGLGTFQWKVEIDGDVLTFRANDGAYYRWKRSK